MRDGSIIIPMKPKLELLNLLTGLVLLLVGSIDLAAQQYVGAASWIIFGSMYLVMDNYSSDTVITTPLQKITHYTRLIFSWVGLISSVLFLIYQLITF